MYKDGGFALHCNSEYYRDAMLCWKEFEHNIKHKQTLIDTLNLDYTAMVKKNRNYVKTLGKVIIFTATHNISQRGYIYTDIYTD